MFKSIQIILIGIVFSFSAYAKQIPTVAVVMNPEGRFGNIRKPIFNAIKLYFGDKKDVKVKYLKGGDELEDQRKVAQKIVSEKIRFVIGHNSSKIAKQFLLSLPKDYEMTYISPLATSMELLGLNNGVHIVGPNNKLQIEAIINSVKAKKLKSPRVAMIVNESETYSTEMAKFFEEKIKKELGTENVHRVSYVKNKFIPDEIVDKAMSYSPDVVFAPIYSYELVVMYNYYLEKYSSSKHRPHFLSGDTMGRKNVVYGKLGNNKNKLTGNMSFTANWVPEMKNQESLQFTKRYQKAYGDFPPSAAAAGFDAAKILHLALKTSKKKTAKEVNQAIQNIELKGTIGNISFAPARTSKRVVPLLSLTKDGYKYYGQF